MDKLTKLRESCFKAENYKVSFEVDIDRGERIDNSSEFQIVGAT
jgi:hypothetical protein